MIIVTGAAGFIGSYLIGRLNKDNFRNIVAVDEFGSELKLKNLADKDLMHRVPRDEFFDWLDENYKEVDFIFHLGARTDTSEFDRDLLWRLNTDYSKEVWRKCTEYFIPLVYASSAATYGLGELGYDDDDKNIPQLRPLNPYGESKNEFDKWVLKQEKRPFFWAGLKFFNVYGPGEDHKARMASVIWHAFSQIRETGGMKLFRSHIPDYKDGEQKRDFVYVKNVAEVLMFLMNHRKNSAIYNLGTGTARTFLDLTKATFKAMGVDENISFIDTPEDIRDKYQYFTEANMTKLKSIGFPGDFCSLEEGVEEYVKGYLQNQH